MCWDRRCSAGWQQWLTILLELGSRYSSMPSSALKSSWSPEVTHLEHMSMSLTTSSHSLDTWRSLRFKRRKFTLKPLMAVLTLNISCCYPFSFISYSHSAPLSKCDPVFLPATILCLHSHQIWFLTSLRISSSTILVWCPLKDTHTDIPQPRPVETCSAWLPSLWKCKLHDSGDGVLFSAIPPITRESHVP